MVGTTLDIPKKRSTRHRDLIALLVFAVVAALFHFNFTMSMVKGRSMEPTLHDGQIVLVGKQIPFFSSNALKRGDIIIFHQDGETLVKRVSLVPGDPLPDGRTLPQGFFYVLGDNPPMSEDSRSFGPIAATQIVGRLLKAKPL